MQGVAWDKDKVIEALEPYFKLDYSVNKACEIIGIPQSTVQTWIDEDEELRLKIQSWRAEMSVLARKNWKGALIDGVPTKFGPNTYSPAVDWLSRRDKDFSTKTEQDVNFKGELKDTSTPMPDDIKQKLAELYEEEMRKKILNNDNQT